MTQQHPPQPPPYGQPDPRQWQGYAQQVPPAPKKKRRWPWIVGGVVLFLILVSAIGGNSAPAPSAPAAAGSPSAAATPAAPQDDAASGSTVVYEVIGQGTANNVTYMKEGFSQEQQTAAKLPFRKELQFKDEVGSFAPLSLVAQNGARGGDITCRITVDGKVVGESTSSGQYAVVTCNGNG